MKKRRNPILSGCGCLLSLPAALMALGAFLAGVQGNAPWSNMAVTMVCSGAFALLSLGLFGWGISKRTLSAEEAMRAAAAKLGSGTGASQAVDLPDGTSAAEARGAFRAAFGSGGDPSERDWGAATDLMMRRQTGEAMRAFEAIAAAHPHRRADALTSIGACLHLEGRYAEAIDAYERARAEGGDPFILDENIAESRAAGGR